MVVQSFLSWFVLAAGVVLTAIGLSGGMLTHSYWDAAGALKLALFTAVYALLTAVAAKRRPGLFPWLLGVPAVAFAALTAGPSAVVGVAWLSAGAFATGAWMLRTRTQFIARYPQVVALLGLAVWAVAVNFTASLTVHYWWVYAAALTIPILQLFRLGLLQPARLVLPETPHDVVWAAVAVFPAALNWMIALKPEVSADGLSVHLPLLARTASKHFWAFDASEFSWAVKPMTGDWVWLIAYLFGGEGAAKLMNALMLVIISWLLYTWLHELVPGRLAALLTAAFASTPLVMRVTGSLAVENVAAAFFLAALIFYRRYLKALKLPDALAAAALTGAAASTTISSAAILVPFGLAALLTLRLRHAVYAGLLSLAAGLEPYVSAAVRTGNPILPHMNHYFRSPLYDDVAPIIDPSLAPLLTWRAWFDITFHTSRFGDGGDGSLGVLFLVLAPLAVVAVRQTWPRVGFAALWTSLAGAAIVFTSRPDILNIYPVLPMLTLAGGVAASALRAHSERLGHGVSAWCTAAILIHLALMPAAAPQHAGFFLTPGGDGAAVRQFLARFAPERPLVDHLNRTAPNARVAWIESASIADFAGRAFTTKKQNWAFGKALRTSTAAEGHLYQAVQNQIEYFVAPAAGQTHSFSDVFMREFLDLYTEPVRHFAGVELRKLLPDRRSLAALPQPYAPPGTHDEVNSYVRYEGPWSRDTAFAQAHAGTLAYTNDARSRVHIRFQGRAITLIHTAAANRCTLLVALDGGDDVSFSEYSGATRFQARSARFDAPPGYHTLVMRFPQPRQGASSVLGCFADLDGFIVE